MGEVPSLRLFQDPTLCPNCHRRNRKQDRYCENCGTALPQKAVINDLGGSADDPPIDRHLKLGRPFSPTGRIGRKEYWIVQVGGTAAFIIALIGVILVLERLGFLEGSNTDSPTLQSPRGTRFDRNGDSSDGALWAALAIAGLPCLLVILCTSIKRLHDVGRSGWWLLIGWVPFFNVVLLFTFAFVRGNNKTNCFGTVNSGTAFPFLHPRNDRYLQTEVEENRERGWPLIAIALAIASFGLAILVF